MDDYGSSDVSVTIKVPESKKYAGDNPWFVFRGGSPDTLKAKIGAAIGVEHEGLTLMEVTINAQRVASGLGAVAHGLGGKVLSSGPAPAEKAAEAPQEASKSIAESTAGDVWSQANSEPAEEKGSPEEDKDKDPILEFIAACTDVKDLQQYWAENQAAFNSNPDYMAAYKAKGKALTS